MSLIEDLIDELRLRANYEEDRPSGWRVGNAQKFREAASELEAMQAFLRRFIEIEEGTDQTGFDPHVEQMLMDLAKEVRASLDRQGK